LIRFTLLLIFSAGTLTGGTAWAQAEPDNRYCSAGDLAGFGSSDGPAALPRACVYTAAAQTPSGGQVINVAAGGDLQGALNQAQCGDTVAIAVNGKFTGNFVLPALSCDSGHWITMRTAAPDTSLPLEGTRLTPCYAGVTSLAGRPALNCAKAQRVIPQILSPNEMPAIKVAGGGNHYRLVGLEITRTIGTGYAGALLEAAVGKPADHIIVDRSWLHGSAQDDTATAVHFGGMRYAAVIDSYLSDIHCTSLTGSCSDAHAVVGGVGSLPEGPFKVVGNYVEASGENIMFGGGAATTTPTDIEIRRNHMYKPMTWKPGQAGFVGGKGGNPFIVKNLTELKNAQRVLFEGNIFENTWGGFTQHGAVILLTAKNQMYGTKAVCPLCQVTDVTIRYSTMSHSGMGISIAAALTGIPTPTNQAKAEARYSIHDITLDDINATEFVGGGTLFQIYTNWKQNGLNSVTINHVTGFTDVQGHLFSLTDPVANPKIPGFVFTNNVVLVGRYPVWSGGGGNANCAKTTSPNANLNGCFANYTFATNAILGSPSADPPSTWPANNLFGASPATALFVNYNNADGGNYQLLSASPYKNAGTDGKDLGADMNAVVSAIAGVE
jgi:hypothetical protein